MPKRIAIASLLLLAAVAAVLWSDRPAARAPARSATARESASATADAPSADHPAAPDSLPEARLFGRVLEEGADAPIAGAAVVAFAFETARTFRTTGAADGTFDLPDAPAAGKAFQLVARHDGFGTVSIRCAASAAPIVVRLPKGGGLRGRVVAAESHAPVSPCRVSVLRCLLEEEVWNRDELLFRQLLPVDLVIEATAATRADGSFEMADLPPGKYALLVEAQGFAPYSLGSWDAKERVEVRVAAVAEVEVALPRTEAFLVDVFDEETGQPLDAVRFEEGLEVERWTTFAPAPGTRRGDGAYELCAGYGEHRLQDTWLRISRDGYASRIVSFGGQNAGYRFRVPLGCGGTIAGHVRASGGLVPGALVLVEWESGGTIVASAITGPDGAFEIGALDAGDQLTVHVYDRTLDPIAVVSVVLENGKRRTLEIGGAGATAIEGRVAVGGKPAADVSVRVSGTGDSDAVTGKDGEYRVEGLKAGRHEVEVFTDGAYFDRHVDLAEGQRLRLDIDASAVIPGVVVDAGTGAPLTGIGNLEVFARRLDRPPGDCASADVDKDGRFRLQVEPGVHEIDFPEADEVYVPERPRVDLTQGTESEPVTLRVVRDPKDGRIVLDVKDGATGETVPDGEYDYESGRTTGSGSFEGGEVKEEGLPLGAHRFRVHSDAHAPTTVEITLTPEHRLVRQTVALPPADAVRIKEIERGSPAALAGLRIGDVILTCNGNRTASIAALNAALGEARGAVAIEFERGGERKTATLASNEIGAELENILLGRWGRSRARLEGSAQACRARVDPAARGRRRGALDPSRECTCPRPFRDRPRGRRHLPRSRRSRWHGSVRCAPRPEALRPHHRGRD